MGSKFHSKLQRTTRFFSIIMFGLSRSVIRSITVAFFFRRAKWIQLKLEINWQVNGDSPALKGSSVLVVV
jgi:hypothetical protein